MKGKPKGLTWLGAILVLALIVAWLAFGKRGLVHLYRMEGKRQEYRARIEDLEKRNHELLLEIERLRTNEGYIESVARKELNLLKEDEVHYHFAEKSQSGTTSTKDPEALGTEDPVHSVDSTRDGKPPASN